VSHDEKQKIIIIDNSWLVAINGLPHCCYSQWSM